MTEAATGWWRPIASLVGLVVAYFAFPVDWGASVAYLASTLALTVVGLSVLAWIMVLELQHLRSGVAGRSAQVLTTVLVLLVMSFSLTAYLVQELSPGQFVGISSRVDALYFTLSTMTTVGYGDAHAEGQLARVLVCGLIVFNVVVVASLLRAHTRLRRSEP